ncbi:unnamed protein product [Blepharisma stoltei]|uniref:J domain-containing protein n=1 Tax=Blepharisma stoltei TaxID=1481888 RepID=A0AAU9IFN6_9CILI|nr:unnamed protein product [Blepharisma stoltei]
MAKNYYSTLGITREATDEEISQAYRQLALRWHPSKKPDDPHTATHMFNELAEAYEVLSNDIFKSCYDMYGEYGLKEGVIDGKGGYTGGYRYRGNAEEIFEKFFGSPNPFYGGSDEATIAGSLFGAATRGMKQVKADPPQDLIVEVPCTLAELYLGCQKRVTYEKIELNNDRITTSKVLNTKNLEIRRGYSNQTIISFPGDGNESPHYPNSQLIFKIVELPHEAFQRKGNDLIYTAKIQLVDALMSDPIQITALDGRVLTLSFDEVVSLSTRKMIENEGMPVFKDNEYANDLKKFGLDKRSIEKGNLIVRFDIEFPQYIPEEKKRQLKLLLS